SRGARQRVRYRRQGVRMQSFSSRSDLYKSAGQPRAAAPAQEVAPRLSNPLPCSSAGHDVRADVAGTTPVPLFFHQRDIRSEPQVLAVLAGSAPPPGADAPRNRSPSM